MNVFLYWSWGMNSPAVRKLLEHFNASLCAYIHELEDDHIDAASVKALPVYQFAPLDFYCENESEMLPLDAKVLEGMRPYTMTAMDIINRWRRGITTDHSYANLRKIYMIFLRYWNNLLLTNKVGFVYIQGLPHTHQLYFLYALCKIHDIPVVMQNLLPSIDATLLRSIFVINIEDQGAIFSNKIREIQKLSADNPDEITLCPEFTAYFENYSRNAEEVKRVVLYEEKNTVKEKASKYFDRIKVYLSSKRYKILIRKALYFIWVKQKNRKLLSYIERKEINPDLSAKYFFFPLHFQPESTTLPQGGVFVDQLEVIRVVAASLPEGYKLYVKEHPSYWMYTHWESMEEARSRGYYDDITAIENVKLISHDFSSMELIDRCAGVVTVTGTAGFEAIFRSKPVLLFGSQAYSEFPGVFKIRFGEDCVKAVNQIINGEYSISCRDLRIALKAIEPFVNFVTLADTAFGGRGSVSNEDKIMLVDSMLQFTKAFYDLRI